MMLKVLTGAAVAAAVVGCANTGRTTAAKSAFPLGAYTIRSAQVDYYGDGTYKIYNATQVFVEGRYEVDGDVIVMTDVGGQYGCKGDTNPARYRWSSDGASITYVLIEDRCEARRTAMQESPFAKRDR